MDAPTSSPSPFPSLLRHPHYYSLSGAPLSISPHRTFSSSPFFLGTRRRLPFVLVSHPLFHGRSVRSARARARVALRSPRERINDECFTLSPEVGPFAFARARSVLPLSTMFSAHSVFHDPFLSSLAFTSKPVFPPAISLPRVSRAPPEWRSPRFSRNSESRLRSRTLFLFPLLQPLLPPRLFPSPLESPSLLRIQYDALSFSNWNTPDYPFLSKAAGSV